MPHISIKMYTGKNGRSKEGSRRRDKRFYLPGNEYGRKVHIRLCGRD